MTQSLSPPPPITRIYNDILSAENAMYEWVNQSIEGIEDAKQMLIEDIGIRISTVINEQFTRNEMARINIVLYPNDLFDITPYLSEKRFEEVKQQFIENEWGAKFNVSDGEISSFCVYETSKMFKKRQAIAKLLEQFKETPNNKALIQQMYRKIR